MEVNRTDSGRKRGYYEKGIEIVKEVYFCKDKNIAQLSGMEYSEKWSFMQIMIDWDKKEVITFLKSTWNSTYDTRTVTKF